MHWLYIKSKWQPTLSLIHPFLRGPFLCVTSCDLMFPVHDILMFFNCQHPDFLSVWIRLFYIMEPAYLSPIIINPFYLNYCSISRANHSLLKMWGKVWVIFVMIVTECLSDTHTGSVHILRKVHRDVVKCISVLPETQKPEKKSAFQFIHLSQATTLSHGFIPQSFT